MDSKGMTTQMIAVIVVVVCAAVILITSPFWLNLVGVGDSGTSVMVVGVPSTDVVRTLSGKEAQMKGIYYPIDIDPSYITLDVLRNYDIVILQGDPYFDMNTREAIGDYVDGGGNLIVVGNAGSLHPEFENVAGWSWPLGDGIPVPAEMIGEWAGWQDVAYGAEMRITDINHPLFEGMPMIMSLPKPSQVYKVIAKGNVLMAIETTEGTVPALIEGNSGLGTVMYFAFDPSEMPELLLTSVVYLAGI